MDVDAILGGKPQTVVVDELAHTNVPGSKNRKRYEDVLELLDAGINVMTAVNIQHLETLNDAVNASANTTIRETVPDSFLKRADEVVNVDVTVNELAQPPAPGQNLRCRKSGAVAGQLLPHGQPEPAARAGVCGRRPSRSAREQRNTGVTRVWSRRTIPEKVMVCLVNAAGNGRLLRVGSRIAGRLATNWYAVYVTQPDDDKGHGDPEAYHRLEEVQRMARDLGAQVVTSDRQECLRCADSVCATGEHFACGLRPVGAIAVGYSAAGFGAEPLSGRGARRDRAGCSDAEADSQGLIFMCGTR